jgi:hypothetical protein
MLTRIAGVGSSSAIERNPLEQDPATSQSGLENYDFVFGFTMNLPCHLNFPPFSCSLRWGLCRPVLKQAAQMGKLSRLFVSCFPLLLCLTWRYKYRVERSYCIIANEKNCP